MKEIYISLQMGPTFETFFFILKKKHLKQLSLINMSCVFGVVSHWEEGHAQKKFGTIKSIIHSQVNITSNNWLVMSFLPIGDQKLFFHATYHVLRRDVRLISYQKLIRRSITWDWQICRLSFSYSFLLLEDWLKKNWSISDIDSRKIGACDIFVGPNLSSTGTSSCSLAFLNLRPSIVWYKFLLEVN